jgi:hypothetical protein
MGIPIEGKGDAVLVISRQASAVLMGFVTTTTIAKLIGYPISPCESVAYVKRHLLEFETALAIKAPPLAPSHSVPHVDCTEIGLEDLVCAGLCCSERP